MPFTSSLVGLEAGLRLDVSAPTEVPVWCHHQVVKGDPDKQISFQQQIGFNGCRASWVLVSGAVGLMILNNAH